MLDRQRIIDACAVALLSAARASPAVESGRLVQRLRETNPEWGTSPDELQDILRRLARTHGVALAGRGDPPGAPARRKTSASLAPVRV
jgi:hypothetical protein